MQFQKRRFSFISKYDQVRIHGICLIPDKPIAVLQMVHGMNEYKERYLSLMEKMAEKGYITVMHDNRGHGESVMDKKDIGFCYASMEKGYVEDIYNVTVYLRRCYPELPLVLYGHSMGSLGTRAYLQKYDDAIDGLILSGSPCYFPFVPVGSVVVRILAKMLGMRYRLETAQAWMLKFFDFRFRHEGREFAWLSADPDIGERFKKDPRCIFTYTLNGFTTLLHLETLTYKAGGYQMKNPDLPILFLSGKDDPCYGNEGLWKKMLTRMRSLGYTNVKQHRYKGMRHEIHNEIGKEMVVEDMDRFMRKIVNEVR